MTLLKKGNSERRKNWKKDKSGKEKLQSTIVKRQIQKKDNSEKDNSGKGQIRNTQFLERVILVRNKLTKDKSEK